MNKELKDAILLVIANAQDTYYRALDPDNIEDMGYPYTAGYSRAALKEIKSLLEFV